ncbi:MAG: zinc ribbon domain-containing protein [Chloroflexota bacterium]
MPDILEASRKEQIMFLMWIIPLLLIGLIIYAIGGNNLVNAFRPVSGHACPRCGRAVQNDWKNCPHCGQTL